MNIYTTYDKNTSNENIICYSLTRGPRV